MIKKDQWDKLVIENGQEFLQGWQWGEFQKALGRRVERVKTDNFLVSVIFNPLPLGLNYGYVPRGPVIISNKRQVTSNKGLISEDFFWSQLENIKNKKTIFLEVEPSLPISFLKPFSINTRQPRLTSIVDLTVDTNSLFSNFHRAHRYNVRLAKKRGVVIKKENSWESFFVLSQSTAGRHKFRVWPKNYYKSLWETLGSTGQVEIWSTYKDNKLLASNLYILFGDRATYLFGASNYKHRSLMAPHLLHWRAIQEFKKRGFTEYDFWGIDKDKWPGVTLFKERFGGDEKTYPGSYFKVKRRGWYSLYNLIKAVK